MDRTDAELRQALKSWAASQTPPASGRARLLGAAVRPVKHFAQTDFSRMPGMTQPLFTWTWVYSFQRGEATLRLVS